jgi:hypothetical protein
VIYLAVGDIAAGEKEVAAIEDLQQQFSNRPIWMAASIHKGEDESKHLRHPPFLFIGSVLSALPRNCVQD